MLKLLKLKKYFEFAHEHKESLQRDSNSDSDIASVSSNEFPDIQATTGWRFTLTRIFDMIRTHIQHKQSKIFHEIMNFDAPQNEISCFSGFMLLNYDFTHY